MDRRRVSRLPALTALGLACCASSLAGGCSGEGTPFQLPPVIIPPSSTVLDSVVATNSSGVAANGQFTVNAFPVAGTAASPTITASSANPQVVRGGALLLGVDTPPAISEMRVGVDGDTGHFVLPVSGGSRQAGRQATGQHFQLIVAVKSDAHFAPIPGPTGVGGTAGGTGGSTGSGLITHFVLRVATRGQDGTFSAWAMQPVTINTTAQTSNRLQVSMSFSAPVDLDLHLRTPDGTEIGYNQRTGSGGMLDLDSNAGCAIDNVDVENITWTTSTPANGNYTIRPDLYDACSQAGPFPYVVIVNKNGRLQVFAGRFNASEVDRNDPSATAPSRQHQITFAYP